MGKAGIMSQVKIERRLEINPRMVFDVSETLIEVERNAGAENASCSQRPGRSASFRSKEEAEEYISLLGQMRP